MEELEALREAVRSGKCGPLISILIDQNKEMRRERDAAQRLATEYEKGLSIAEHTCRDLGRANAKKDAALRHVAELAYAGAKNAKTLELIEKTAITALTASQEAPGHTDLMVAPESIDAFMEANPLPEEAPEDTTWRDEHQEPPSQEHIADAGQKVSPASPSPGHVTFTIPPEHQEYVRTLADAHASPSPDADFIRRLRVAAVRSEDRYDCELMLEAADRLEGCHGEES